MMKYILVGLMLSVLCQAGEALPITPKEGGKKEKYKDTTVLDFSEASVDGEFMRPDAQAVKGEQNLEFDSLMDSRQNFKKELKRSSGAIR